MAKETRKDLMVTITGDSERAVTGALEVLTKEIRSITAIAAETLDGFGVEIRVERAYLVPFAVEEE